MNAVCFPNETDELARIEAQAEIMDKVLDIILNPRSPRAMGAQSPAISLPVAGTGTVDSQHSFDRDTQATGV